MQLLQYIANIAYCNMQVIFFVLCVTTLPYFFVLASFFLLFHELNCLFIWNRCPDASHFFKICCRRGFIVITVLETIYAHAFGNCIIEYGKLKVGDYLFCRTIKHNVTHFSFYRIEVPCECCILILHVFDYHTSVAVCNMKYLADVLI